MIGTHVGVGEKRVLGWLVYAQCSDRKMHTTTDKKQNQKPFPGLLVRGKSQYPNETAQHPFNLFQNRQITIKYI